MSDRPHEEPESGFRQASEFDRADRICDAYEREWIAGRKPSVADFLAMAPEVDGASLRRELELIEQDYQDRAVDPSAGTNHCEADQDTTRKFGASSENHQRQDGYRIAHLLAEDDDFDPDGATGTGELSHRGNVDVSESKLADRKADEQVAAGPLADVIPGYSIVKELHRGGQGVVYLAIQTSTRQQVALKVMLQGPFASTDSKRRFEREIELVGSLHHPNIAKIFDSGVAANGQLYFAMQYVQGQRLTDHVRDNQLSLDETLHLFQKVCEAVDHAHQRGVIHRDLKPSNIFVDDRDEQPYVLDFGLAKIGGVDGDQFSQLSLTGQIVGTPAYMSPEQAAGLSDQIDLRSDVYALGVILYELVTGQMPYDVSGPITSVLKTIQESDPIRPRSISRRINDEVEKIALKALSKEKQRRYATAGMLGEDIGRHLSGQPIEAKRDSALYLFRKSLRRYKAVATVAVVLAAVVTVALIVSLSFWRQAVDGRAVAEQAQRAAVESRQAARRQSYQSDMNLACQSYEEGNIGRVFELLEKHWPDSGDQDLRGFEWYHWWHAAHLEHGFIRHPWRAPFSSLAISPDGRTGAAVGFPSLLFIFDTAELRLLGSPIDLAFPPGPSPDPVAFSPNGRYVIAGAAENGGNVRVYESRTGALSKTVSAPGNGGIASFAFSPAKPLMASGGQGKRIVLWNTQSWEPQAHWDTDANVLSVAFTPDGASVVAALENSTLVAWSVASGDIQQTISAESVRVITCSPSRGLFATASDKSVRLWSHELKPIASAVFETSLSVTSLAFSLDGRRLVGGTSDHNTVLVWDVEPDLPSLELAHTIRGHSKKIQGVAFARDDDRVWSADGNGYVKVWNLSQCEPSETLKHVAGATGVAYTADANQTLLIVDQDAVVHRWSAAAGSPLKPFNAVKAYGSVAISDNGSILVGATLDGDLEIWDLANGVPKMTSTLPGPAPIKHLAIASGGSRVALLTDNETVVMETASGKSQVIPTGTANHSMALSADGQRLAISPWATTQIWDVTADPPNLLKEVAGWGPENYCAFSPQGDLLAVASYNSEIRVHDAESGRLMKTLKGHTDQVFSIAFSHDGASLVSGGKDHTLRIWDVKTGALLSTFHGHDAPVTSVDFSPTGDSVASRSDDGTVKIWLATSKTEVNQGIAAPIERADHYAALGDWEKADQILSQAMKSNTQSPELLVARGNLYVRQENSAAAIADYTQAIQMGPADGMLLKQRADLHAQLSHRNEAINDYAQAMILSEELRSKDAFEQIWSSLPGIPLVPVAARWRYTTVAPPENWQDPVGFDDTQWETGQAPFGWSDMDPKPNTTWGRRAPDDIWMRHTFQLERPVPAPLVFQAMVDDVAEIYVNGVKAAELAWRGDRYQTVNFPEHMGLRLGSNVLAVHCRSDSANGKIDVGLLSQGDEQAAAEILDHVLEAVPDSADLQQLRAEWTATRGR